MFLLEENMYCSLLSSLVWRMIVEVSCFSSEGIIEWGWGAVLGYSCECKQAGADCGGPSQTSEKQRSEKQNGNSRTNKEISSAI